MTYLSLFSGIEAASVAWAPIDGFRCVGVSEIEPFCCRLLKHHYPGVTNYGDVTKFKEWNVEPGSVDLVVGGSPCQSFSVAGLRKGMDDPRGNLTLVYLGVVAHLRPRWVLWENVPGVLSIDDGKVFGSFLGALGELGYGFAYRVLDAQYVRVDGHERSVPQRRRRVFVVGHLGDWRRAASVLFERACLSGDPAPGRGAGQGVAGSLESRSTAGGFPGTDGACAGYLVPETSWALQERDAKGPDSSTKEGHLIVSASQPLTGNPYGDNASREGLLVCAVRTAQTSANGHGVAEGVAHTMDGANGQAVCFKPSHFTRGKDGAPDEVAPPLSADADKGDQDSVVCTLAIRGRGDGSNMECRMDGTSNALIQPNGGRDGIGVGAIHTGPCVRRLTPTECERLQGFPDGYTDIPGAKDSPRYRALGNSMAVNVMRYIGRRIEMVEKIPS